LGESCLELRSSKARKLGARAQLQEAWGLQGTIDAEVWQTEAQPLKKLRDELKRYVERLHHRHENLAQFVSGINMFPTTTVSALLLCQPSFL
jgi:hypothetical protein